MEKVKAFKCQRTGKTFPTEAEARASENKLDRTKLAALKKRIAAGKPWTPKVGDYVYVRTMMSIDHGEDDVVGGLAEVTRVYDSMSGGDAKCKFIEIMQHDRGGNWTQFLCPEQKRLMRDHGNSFARPDPDYGYAGDPNAGWQ